MPQIEFQVGERSSLAQARNGCLLNFASTTANAKLAGQAWANVGNDLGAYYTMLQTFSQTLTFAQMETALNDSTFYLRPLSNMSQIRGATSARLISFSARSFDFSGDADPFPGVEIGGWQPNFFRPRVEINKSAVVFGGNNDGYFNSQIKPAANNMGDQSMGLPLNYCEDMNLQFVADGVQGISGIDVYAPCGRILAATGAGSIQIYPVMVSLYFVLNEI